MARVEATSGENLSSSFHSALSPVQRTRARANDRRQTAGHGETTPARERGDAVPCPRPARLSNSDRRRLVVLHRHVLLPLHLLQQELDHHPLVPTRQPRQPLLDLHEAVLPRSETAGLRRRSEPRGGPRHGHRHRVRRRGEVLPYVGHLGTESPQARADLSRRTCAERDSPKSHFIVISFLVITSILLAIAGLKHYGIDLQAMSSRMGLRGMLTVSRFSSPRHCRSWCAQSVPPPDSDEPVFEPVFKL
jgi:hypothetical protein